MATVHDEQLEVWADEIIDAIAPWLRDEFPSDYDDKVLLASTLKHELVAILADVPPTGVNPKST